MSISTMVAPTVLALLPLGLGVPGWIILGVWFAVVGVLFVPVVRWAAARRTATLVGPACLVGRLQVAEGGGDLAGGFDGGWGHQGDLGDRLLEGQASRC